MIRISTGIDQFAAKPSRWLKKNSRVGILCHPSSISAHLEHLATIADRSCHLSALFGPQHGIFGETQDNMIEWQDFKDDRGRPIYSLYGERRRPSPQALDKLDAVIIDLFDIGARYYTFIYTMSYMLEACAERNLPVLILDRPNPLGGQLIEGSILDVNYRSFVGLHPLPVAHGMTIGELALYFSELIPNKPKLSIIKVRNWKRSLDFQSYQQVWTLPSPNMPNGHAARLYTGMCLLEGTSLSEGRGTTRPFELIGAPFIKWDHVEQQYRKMERKLGLSPIHFHRQGFIPTFHKFKGDLCHGALQIPKSAKPFKGFRHGITLLWIFRQLYPDLWTWKEPPYEYEFKKLPIDILAGNPKVRHTIDEGLSLKDLFDEFEEQEAHFRRLRKPFLLYN